jgi:hypothetical protein
VAHTCNPSYSGGWGQEDRSSKPAQETVHETLSRKKSSKNGLVERHKVLTWSSKPGTAKRIKKRERE